MHRAFVSLCLVVAVPLAAADDRPRLGDARNGERLLKAAGATVKVDGAWLNRLPDAALVKLIEQGKGGMPELDSDNVLDAWDVLAAMRTHNTDLRDLNTTSSHVYLADVVLDDNAKTRLSAQGKLAPGRIVDERRVFAFYDVDSRGRGVGAADFAFVTKKDTKKRDALKRDTKTGYAVFVPLAGFRGGQHEVAFALDKDMKITSAIVRAPDGSAPPDLNQAAARFVGKGARGKYEALKPGGGPKVLAELQDPLSDAYLLAAEAVYMYEVDERDYFAFD
jgi:hypothetical protein